MRTLLQLAALLGLAADGAAQSSQTLPVGFDTVNGNAATNFPQNHTADDKWQWHYDNTNFPQAGPITITEISVRAWASTRAVGAFSFPSWTVTLSEATTGYEVASHDPVFANNLGPNTQVVRSGPWNGGPVPPAGGATGTWIPMGLQSSFVFDPASGNDLIIQIEKCGTGAVWGSSMDGQSGAAGTNLGNRYGHTSSCSSASSTFGNNEYVPIVRIDFTGGGGTTVYCVAKTNSLGCVPAISGSGVPSASATSGFTIDAALVRNGKPGLMFYKANGAQASFAFQCGTLCVGPASLRRTPARSSGGNPPPANDCSGLYSLDLNAFAAGAAGGNPDPALLAVGSLVHCQWWGRDQGFGVPCNTTLSNGAEYTVNP